MIEPDGSNLTPTTALGMFLLAWSELETVFEACLASELGLTHQQAGALLEQTGFEDRVMLLTGLLKEKGAEAGDKLELITYMNWIIPRSKWVKGRWMTQDRSIVCYTKYDPGSTKYTSKVFDPLELARLSRGVGTDAAQLRIVFKLKGEDLLKYYNG